MHPFLRIEYFWISVRNNLAVMIIEDSIIIESPLMLLFSQVSQHSFSSLGKNGSLDDKSRFSILLSAWLIIFRLGHLFQI